MDGGRRDFRETARLIAQAMDCWTAFRNLPRSYGVGRRIYPSEIVAIEHIGHEPGINMTALAARLGVTRGAASQTAARLVRKGLVRKRAAVESGREVRLELTARGGAALSVHEAQFELAYRMFQGRYGRAAARRMARFRAVFGEFGTILEAFVRRCPPDEPAEPQTARRAGGRATPISRRGGLKPA